MKIIKPLFVCILFYVSGTTFSQNVSIIPLPRIIQWDTLVYTIPANQVISYNAGAETPAVWMGKLLERFPNVSYSMSGNGNWKIIYDPNLIGDLGKEGYVLDVNAKGIKIQGANETGLFYGIQTLRQMLPDDLEHHVLPAGNISLKYVHIQDSPLYPWRGCMIDLARNFIDPDYLKEEIDMMALYKLNRLHLHLSDDQGWRIEIKSFPELTAIGSKGACNNGTSGYLTQTQYMELQDYALARMITIIPEIDMPGHVYAALASDQDLNCSGFSNLNPKNATPPALYSGTEVGWSKFCLSKPNVVYDFVSKVIGELANITKGKWLHIGGDEISDPLYGIFMHKADSIVRSKGKTSVAWEEAMQENVSNTLLGQVWKGTAANNAGCSTIISICSSFYLDHGNVDGQSNTANWCRSSVTVEDVYNFTMSSSYNNPHGIEAALWTEQVIGFPEFDNRLWPRLTAVAEVAWTKPAQKNLADFKNRLGTQGKRFDYMGVKYFNTPGINWTNGTISVPATNVFDDFMPNTNILLSLDPDYNNSNLAPITIYPNPTAGILNINKRLYNLEVFDSMGNLILQSAEAEQINTTGLKEGLYFICAKNGKGKFIVLH